MGQARMTDREQAEALWGIGYGERVNGVEITYHAWQLAQDRARSNKKPEKREELRAEVARYHQGYNTARGELWDWLLKHPASVRPKLNWREQETALRLALLAVLRREPTAEEMEGARSVYHYSLGQFEEVYQAEKSDKADQAEARIGEPA